MSAAEWIAQFAVAAGAAAVAATSSTTSAIATSMFYVPVSVTVGGAVALISAAALERESAAAEVLLVCAHMTPVLASTHVLITLRRLFGGSFAELQLAQKDTHQRFGQLIGAHLIVSIACVGAAIALGRGSGRWLSAALLAAHAAATVSAAVRVQACRLPDMSKLKDKLGDFQRRARLAAAGCVAVHVPLIVALAANAEWRWSAVWLGGAALQAWTVWVWNQQKQQQS